MIMINLLYIAFSLLVVGAIVVAIISRNREACGWAALGFVSAASACLIYLAIFIFLKGAIDGVVLFSLHPVIGTSLKIRIDPLSALFLFIISIISFCVALFSVRYLNIRHYQKESLLRYYPCLLLFFASIIGVVCVTDMMFFIIFWEIMTLTSWALVVYERENKESLKAGLIYFIVTHFATGCLILSAVILYSYSGTATPSFSFEDLRTVLKTQLIMNPTLVHVVLALFFIGFATKASTLPFGFWLPLAHPIAPSSFSAVLSGVMIKAGIYGLARLFLTILPISTSSQIWGIVIALFGTFSLFIGTMSALTQDDSKRLMAFHSIGQVGYMFLGVGAGFYFLPVNPALATIALVAGLFHMINHSWFKSCLFLNAGSVMYKTGTRDLNKIGGLLSVMPWTGITAIVAALSIGGIPPFNGFVSKLLIFESLILAGKEVGVSILARGLFVILGLAAIFISAVTLASFLKFVNSAFLGKVRGVEETSGRDVPLSMQIPQVILAFLCLLSGVVPLLPIIMVYKAISNALPIEVCPAVATLFGNIWTGISLDFGTGKISGVWDSLWMIVVAVILAGVVSFVVRAGRANVRLVETWYGGLKHLPADTAYRAHSFYRPFKQVFTFQVKNIEFRGLYPTTFPLPKLSMPKGVRTFLNPDQWFYYPVGRLFMKLTRGFAKSHTGNLQLYLLWIAVGVILVIAILLYFPRG
jgi:hydrogenase-4 component B